MAALHAQSFVTPRAWSADEIRALLTDPAVFAETAAEGFALGRVSADEAELLTLAVAPATRRKGLGRALLQAFERTARARGATRALLEVAADNAAACGLYLGAGYAEVGRRPGYYRTPAGQRRDALIYARDLG